MEDKITKHIVDTLNKYEDGPDIEQQVINYSPVKVTPKRTAKGKNAFDEIVKQDEKEYKAYQKNKKILRVLRLRLFLKKNFLKKIIKMTCLCGI